MTDRPIESYSGLTISRGKPVKLTGATKIFTPFVSSYPTSSSFWALQGIKINPYASKGGRAGYIVTGTTGPALSSGGVGAVYVGAINSQNTASGSGSGQ